MSDLDRYCYDLPRHLIAQHALVERTDSRLLVVDRASGRLAHRHIRDLPDLLRPNDCLVINDSKVLPARLVGLRTLTGGKWEGLYLSSDEEGNWRMLARSRAKPRPGETVTLINRRAEEDVRLRLLELQNGGVWLARPESQERTLELLERVGRVPLPPYIRGGEMKPEDIRRYQTVYARHPGSVAAPTAGLHFTDELLRRLIDRGVTPCRVTLHVGLGTFRPLKEASLDAHRMHKERGQIDAAAVERMLDCRASGGRIVCVGTTCARLLETAALSGRLEPWAGKTDLFIRPPFEFRAVDALLTNFHLPRTTLLVLVRTFGGDELIMKAYEEAIRQEYRFYSYGDAMLVL